MTGILYGIGVGPGAPDLITLRAVRTLGEIDVILAPVRTGNDDSLALAIARPYCAATCSVCRLDFPMTRDPEILRPAWARAAERALSFVQDGKKVAFLTLGDPLTYSTFTYLLRAVRARAKDTTIVIIPGITSYQAASARLGEPLCEGAEHLHILSGIAPKESLVRELSHADTAVLLKAYRNMPAITDALRETGRADSVWQVTSVEQEGERIHKGLPETATPYLTLLVSPKSDVDC